MSVTFKDIAEKAGVSYSTVSRVVNDHPAVSPDAARTVRRVMKDLGYRPPPPERRRGPMRGTQRKNPTDTIALLFPDADDRAVRTPLSAAITHGIENYLYDQRLSLIVTHMRESDRLPVCLEKRQVDGLIVRGGDLTAAQINRLRSFPTVWLFQPSRRLDWADQVLPDNDAIGEMALDYFTSLNAKSVLAVTQQPTHASFLRRMRAFSDAATQKTTSSRIVEEGGAEALEAVRQALSSEQQPDAIFCPGDHHDITAVCDILRESGLTPIKDVHVIGCANDPMALRSIYPGLPNISIQAEAIGRTATERLLWRLENPREPAQRLMIGPRLDTVE